MSFGFSVVDLIYGLQRAKDVYDAVKSGPREYREIASEMKTLRYSMHSLSDECKNPASLLNRKGSDRKEELLHIIASCERNMAEVQKVIDDNSSLSADRCGAVIRRWHAYRIGSIDLDSLRGKLTFHAAVINAFLSSLEGSALGRIEEKIDAIYARVTAEDAHCDDHGSVLSTSSTTSSILTQINTHEDEVWKALKTDLLIDGIPLSHVMANRTDIISYVKSLVEKETPTERTQNRDDPHRAKEEVDNVHDRNGPVRATRLSGAITDVVKQVIPLVPTNIKEQAHEMTLARLRFGIYQDRAACMLVFTMASPPPSDSSFLLLPFAEFVIMPANAANWSYPLPYQVKTFPLSTRGDYRSSSHIGMSLDSVSEPSIRPPYLSSLVARDRWKIQGGGSNSQESLAGEIPEHRWELAGRERPARFAFGVIMSHIWATCLVRVQIRYHKLQSLAGNPVTRRSCPPAWSTPTYQCEIVIKSRPGGAKLTRDELHKAVEQSNEENSEEVNQESKKSSNIFRRTM